MKYMLFIFSVYALMWSFVGCSPAGQISTEIPIDTRIEEPSVPAELGEEDFFTPLSWEKNHSERKAWSNFVFEMIGGELFAAFDSAKDAKRICPKYETLSKSQKVTAWGELISATSYYESGWSPTSRMVETTMGTDPVTGKQVASEGLLQLSYQDVPNYGALLKYPKCKIDWSKDKGLDLKDSKKTMLDPYINLECGLRILANQIQKKGYVILSSGVYWAVLKDGGKYSKVDSIIGMVKKLSFCQ